MIWALLTDSFGEAYLFSKNHKSVDLTIYGCSQSWLTPSPSLWVLLRVPSLILLSRRYEIFGFLKSKGLHDMGTIQWPVATSAAGVLLILILLYTRGFKTFQTVRIEIFNISCLRFPMFPMFLPAGTLYLDFCVGLYLNPYNNQGDVLGRKFYWIRSISYSKIF